MEVDWGDKLKLNYTSYRCMVMEIGWGAKFNCTSCGCPMANWQGHETQPLLNTTPQKLIGVVMTLTLTISAIIKTFSEALYNVAINYMVNPNIWHHRMPYYAELISNKTGGVARDIWGFIDGTIC